MAERGTREHGIVPDGAADAPAAPGVVADAWDSHANVLSNQGCMAPQRWCMHVPCAPDTQLSHVFYHAEQLLACTGQSGHPVMHWKGKDLQL